MKKKTQQMGSKSNVRVLISLQTEDGELDTRAQVPAHLPCLRTAESRLTCMALSRLDRGGVMWLVP